MGWEAKLKGRECRPCQAESKGLGHQARRRLRVSSIKGRRSGQRLAGKETWQEDKSDMTWFLEVRMQRSAGRER
jgi:hypothetical protein